MKENILDFQYLWDGTCPQWGLVYLGDEEATQCRVVDRCLIVNLEKESILIIDEDDDLARQVMEKMLSAGVKIFSSSEYSKLFQKPTK
jgi:hypothetical protein